MNKQEKKLIKQIDKADHCTSREEAQKILKKHAKAHKKLLLRHMIDE